MPGDDAGNGTQENTNVPVESGQAGAGAAVADPVPATPETATPPATEQGKAPEGTQKVETAKPGTPPAEVVYDLKLPKDSVLDESATTAVSEFAKANKLTPEVAQSLLERDDANAQAYEQAVIGQIEAQHSAWKDAIAKDPEIGGDKTAAASERAFRVFEKYGTTELKTFLEQSKYGDHPEVLRLFSRIGALMAEDGFVQPGTSSGEQSLAQRMYRNTPST